MRRHVAFASNRYGYVVATVENGEIVDTYEAGNHKHDSQIWTKPGSIDSLSKSEIDTAAEQTAREIAADLPGLPQVVYDEDLEAMIREHEA